MSLVIKKLDKKSLIRNIVKIINISKINYWTFNNFAKDLPGKWEKSIGVFNKLNNQIIAYCIISQKRETLHIHLLMVSEKYQGKGIGSKILKSINVSKSRKINVKTYTHLRRTINFYLKNNFKIEDANNKTILLSKKI